VETPAIASFEHVNVQERVVGDVRWVAIRARGAEWSWLTPQEAVELAREWKERYGASLPFTLPPCPPSRCTTDIEAGTPIPTAGTRTTRSGMRRSMPSLIGADDVDAVRDLLRRLSGAAGYQRPRPGR